MTTHKSFKRLVRARMDKTGEAYTAARAALLAGDDPKAGGRHTGPDRQTNAADPDVPTLLMSDDAIRRRTGRGWEEWFDLLDDAGMSDRPHGEIARWLADTQGMDGWSTQSVTVGYERASGRRAVGERPDGFSIGATKTVDVPVARLYDAFLDPSLQARWLPDGDLRMRTATRPKTARFDWGDGASRVNVGFLAKGEAKSTVAIAHERIADSAEAARMKAYWRDRVAALKALLEA
jgi:hypothetical protein